MKINTLTGDAVTLTFTATGQSVSYTVPANTSQQVDLSNVTLAAANINIFFIACINNDIKETNTLLLAWH